MVIIQYEINNEYVPNIPNPNNYNYQFNSGCGETDVAAPEVNLKIMFAVTAGYMIYSFVNSNSFPETMMRFTYKAVLVYTKVNKAYNNLTTYFSNIINHGNNNNNNNNESTSSESPSTDSFTDYEIRVIKNGIKCEQFETMKIFKKSNYLGNPNDYCDSQDEESESQSSTNESCDICDVCDSQDDDDKQKQDDNQDKIITTEPHATNAKNEQLFIMKHNKQNNTIRFIPYDFIMQTLFSECDKLNKNYTRLYRQFTENDYLITPNDLVISKAGMIVCSLESKDKTYDIDISFPYNFNVVGNVILDYTFLSWYMLKEYDVAHFAADCDYTLTCVSNAVTTVHIYKLGKSSGLLVKLNEYEIISV
jgi:hypothetical protein